jgi:hypothetical protein
VNSKISRLAHLVSIVPRLGFRNILRVATYRVKKAIGLIKFDSPGEIPSGPIFVLRKSSIGPDSSRNGLIHQRLFGWVDTSYSAAPDWHCSVLKKDVRISNELSWDAAMQSVPSGCDIKEFWELSRFYWVPEFAFKLAKGDAGAGKNLEDWLLAWIDKNPLFKGVNWTCGQEASIRLMNLAYGALLLENVVKPTPLLHWIVDAHLKRIAPTLSYAIGQANNHGSAESVALFIGGSWLMKLGDSRGEKLYEVGRRWLVDRALLLIFSDGTGNQYSTTYHRANLEVFCLAEIWRRKLGLPSFPREFSERIRRGGQWLQQLSDLGSGDAPNFGANDGSHLFSLTRSKYRDFRPTVQLVSRVFDNSAAYSAIVCIEDRVSILALPVPTQKWPAPESQTYSDGGHHVLRDEAAVVYFRYPVFKFRPSHADALHVDFWLKGDAVLRDSGSFSYADSSMSLGAVSRHNTIEFDGRDQMPKIGQFLYGAWLRSTIVEPVSKVSEKIQRAAAAYADYRGATHFREVSLHTGKLQIVDKIGNFKSSAVLRWQLQPGNWRLSRSLEAWCLELEGTNAVKIKVTSSALIKRCELKNGWESLHYLEKTEIPVLEVEVHLSCSLTTEVEWVV